MNIRKGYSDGPEGQIHWRMATPITPSNAIDLYCFSPAPFGSIAYSTILPILAKERRVIAPDYPGQSGSDGGSQTPSIEDYAKSMLAVINDLSGDKPAIVLGFHSGCFVAVEAKLRAASKIEQVVLIDVPAFDPETRAKYLPMVGNSFEPRAELEAVSRAWEMAVTKRLETQSIDLCYAMFADTVGNGPRMNATFHAAFTYNVESKLRALSGDTTIIATRSSLLDASRRAATLMSSCDLVELLEIDRSVLDANAAKTARAINKVLESVSASRAAPRT